MQVSEFEDQQTLAEKLTDPDLVRQKMSNPMTLQQDQERRADSLRPKIMKLERLVPDKNVVKNLKQRKKTTFKKEKIWSNNAERIANLANLPRKRPKKRRPLLMKNLPKILSEKEFPDPSEQRRSIAIQLKNLMERHLRAVQPPRTSLASTITIRTTLDAEIRPDDPSSNLATISVSTITTGSTTIVGSPNTSKISSIGTKVSPLEGEEVSRTDCNLKAPVIIDPRPIMGLTNAKTMVIRPRITTRDIKAAMDIRGVIRGDSCRGIPKIIVKVGTCRGLATLGNPTRLRISTAQMAVPHHLLTREESLRCSIHENEVFEFG